jgi:hypothetical protein
MFSSRALSTFVALATLVPFAAAHGSLRNVNIDGLLVPGPIPAQEPGEFAIREVFSVDPVKGTDNPDLNCGAGARNAALVADVKPGSVLKFNWANGEEGPWPHNTGPILTYMAPCGPGGCVNFDPKDAEFFKIDEKGINPATGTWFQADIFQNQDATSDVVLPSNLPSGEYLVRHEIIGLHLGTQEGGAEFYPSCTQVRMIQPDNTSSKFSLPDASFTTKFPGGYGPQDPGILVPNVYDSNLDYQFPGPQVIPASVSSDPAPEDPAPAPENDPAEPAPENPLPPCGGYKKKMKRVVKKRDAQSHHKSNSAKRQQHQEVAAAAVIKREARPFVMSRVMRGIN